MAERQVETMLFGDGEKGMRMMVKLPTFQDSPAINSTERRWILGGAGMLSLIPLALSIVLLIAPPDPQAHGGARLGLFLFSGGLSLILFYGYRTARTGDLDVHLSDRDALTLISWIEKNHLKSAYQALLQAVDRVTYANLDQVVLQLTQHQTQALRQQWSL